MRDDSPSHVREPCGGRETGGHGAGFLVLGVRRLRRRREAHGWITTHSSQDTRNPAPLNGKSPVFRSAFAGARAPVSSHRRHVCARVEDRLKGARLRASTPRYRSQGGKARLVTSPPCMRACAREGAVVPGASAPRPPLQEPRRKIGTRARLVERLYACARVGIGVDCARLRAPTSAVGVVAGYGERFASCEGPYACARGMGSGRLGRAPHRPLQGAEAEYGMPRGSSRHIAAMHACVRARGSSRPRRVRTPTPAPGAEAEDRDEGSPRVSGSMHARVWGSGSTVRGSAPPPPLWES